jgi:hypothetical protein
MFFTFLDDARWNAERQAVEIDEYLVVVRVRRRVFQGLLSERPPRSAASKPTPWNALGSRASASASSAGAS